MPEHRFQTPDPVHLVVETGKGHVRVQCAETAESTVRVEGRHADDVVVEHRGDTIVVTEPGRGRLFGGDALRVDVLVPAGSNPSVRTGSADVQVDGRAGHTQLRTGSGDVTVAEAEGHLLVETGSGDVRVGHVHGDLRVKSGSGDVDLDEVSGAVTVSTGSGDVAVKTVHGAAVVKTGSGDLTIGQAHADTSFSTGSGDARIGRVDRGRVLVKGASSDVSVGVRSGVPVWTDVTTVSGTIRSDLQGAGQPEEGQDHVEVRARTISGDIALREV